MSMIGVVWDVKRVAVSLDAIWTGKGCCWDTLESCLRTAEKPAEHNGFFPEPRLLIHLLAVDVLDSIVKKDMCPFCFRIA